MSKKITFTLLLGSITGCAVWLLVEGKSLAFFSQNKELLTLIMFLLIAGIVVTALRIKDARKRAARRKNAEATQRQIREQGM